MVPIPTPADKEKSEAPQDSTTTLPTTTDEPLKPDEPIAPTATGDLLTLDETPDLTIPGATTTTTTTTTVAAAAAVPKKAKAESKEGPMGELRPTDILAGNYRKRAGNYLYKKLLREHAPDVGKVEMRILVAKVVEGIAGQDPPGKRLWETTHFMLVSLRPQHESSLSSFRFVEIFTHTQVVSSAKVAMHY